MGSQGLEPRMPEALDLQSSAVTCSARYPKKKCSDSARRSFYYSHKSSGCPHLQGSHRSLGCSAEQISCRAPAPRQHSVSPCQRQLGSTGTTRGCYAASLIRVRLAVATRHDSYSAARVKPRQYVSVLVSVVLTAFHFFPVHSARPGKGQVPVNT